MALVDKMHESIRVKACNLYKVKLVFHYFSGVHLVIIPAIQYEKISDVI